jgi:hypothetical protein
MGETFYTNFAIGARITYHASAIQHPASSIGSEITDS